MNSPEPQHFRLISCEIHSSVTGTTHSNRPLSPSPRSLHSPAVLAAYCRLPRFLKGERGLLLVPVAVPWGRLEDMIPGCAVQLGTDWKRRAE